MPHARVNGLQLYFEHGGDGPRLLFISGTGGDLRNRPNVFDGPLPKSFSVLAYDQRGLGRSDKPDEAYTMAHYADDAAGLLDHVGWDDAYVIGVSFGGMVAQELVLRHPDRVRRAVLACTSPGGEGGSSYPFHEITHLRGEARARHLLPISDLRHDDEWAKANPDQFDKLLAMASAEPFTDEPGHAEGAWRQIEARSNHNCWDRLDQISRPVLIAAGRHDGIALLATQERMLNRIPGAELQVFEGGHLFLLQDKNAYPAVTAWLLSEERASR
jgi:3-oxoadipate enol-lactonase